MQRKEMRSFQVSWLSCCTGLVCSLPGRVWAEPNIVGVIWLSVSGQAGMKLRLNLVVMFDYFPSLSLVNRFWTLTCCNSASNNNNNNKRLLRMIYVLNSYLNRKSRQATTQTVSININMKAFVE